MFFLPSFVYASPGDVRSLFLSSSATAGMLLVVERRRKEERKEVGGIFTFDSWQQLWPLPKPRGWKLEERGKKNLHGRTLYCTYFT